jgi:hypothetical protein
MGTMKWVGGEDWNNTFPAPKGAGVKLRRAMSIYMIMGHTS